MTKTTGPVSWYVAEYCALDPNFPYMIRDGQGKAIAKVMTAEDAGYIVATAGKLHSMQRRLRRERAR